MVFITAEIGTNWMGDYNLLEYLVKYCKRIGINAIKLQALSPELLERHSELPWYPKASINRENIASIDKICKKNHMEWYCTPTYAESIDFLEEYVNIYKIRTLDNENKQLCDRVFNTGKKVIISSQKPLRYDDKRIINLYCIPRYPTQFQEHNFNLMRKFDGFSNHCLNPMAILKAVMLGAKYIEFHITPTKDMFILDNHVSFTPEEATEIMRWISVWTLSHKEYVEKLRKTVSFHA